MRAALVLSWCFLAGIGLPLSGQRSPGSTVPDTETCDEASRRLFGEPPTRLAGHVKALKRLQYVAPQYPQLPPGTVGSGVWVAEALIGLDGRIAKLSVVHDLVLKPPYPQFSKAISDAILQWKYAPTTIDGKTLPVCMTVSVNINWR